MKPGFTKAKLFISMKQQLCKILVIKNIVLVISENSRFQFRDSTGCYYHVTYQFQSESTLYGLPECQGTPCSKQALYPKFKWQQRDANAQPLSS